MEKLFALTLPKLKNLKWNMFAVFVNRKLGQKTIQF